MRDTHVIASDHEAGVCHGCAAPLGGQRTYTLYLKLYDDLSEIRLCSECRREFDGADWELDAVKQHDDWLAREAQRESEAVDREIAFMQPTTHSTFHVKENR